MNSPSKFRKATKDAVFLNLAMTGPSGSGKTTAALRLARGLTGANGKIAVIDTENSSSLLYADKYDFDACVLEPPYTEEKFIGAIVDAISAKYDCVIIDSFSHVWQAILDYKSKLDMRGGNSYTNWANAGAKFDSVLQAILVSKLHIICCMRSKMDYAIDTDERGKKSIRKVGLAPIMRDGIEFEFSLVLDLDMNHKAVASKDRTRLFDGKIEEITESTGEILNNWRLGKSTLLEKTANSSASKASSKVATNAENTPDGATVNSTSYSPNGENPQSKVSKTLSSDGRTMSDDDDDIPMDFPDDLKSIIGSNECAANIALRAWGWIKADETWEKLSAEHIAAIKEKPREFFAKALEVAKQIGRNN